MTVLALMLVSPLFMACGDDELDVCGLFVAELCDKIRYKSVAFANTGTLRLKETAYIFDSKGFHTRLKLVEDRNLEEVSYVDE